MRVTFSGIRGPASRPATRQFKKVSSLATNRFGSYNTGIGEADVEGKGSEDGHAGILDPATVGVNSHPHAVDGLAHAHDAAAGVVSYDTRGGVQGVHAALEAGKSSVAVLGARAKEAISDWEVAQRRLILLLAFMKTMGLPVPSKRSFVVLVVALVALFMGDWGLITLGYQVLGLSDHPWIPGLAFTDDLHLAAFSSVFGLVVLGDIAGDRLRRIEYALNNRRLTDELERDNSPKPAIFDVIWLTVCLLGALAGLGALSHIRSDYLKALGTDASGLAFFAIQLVIMLAAIALGHHHANPEAKNWAAADKKATSTEDHKNEAMEAFSTTVAQFNTDVEQRDAVLAMAGHHINTDAANCRVQTTIWKRRYLLSQLEPVQEQLFAQHKSPREYTNDQLLALITGITPLTTYTKVTTDQVITELEKARIRLDRLRARIDQVDITKLNLPQLDEETSLDSTTADENEAEPPASTAKETQLHPVRETAAPATEDEKDDVDEESA